VSSYGKTAPGTPPLPDRRQAAELGLPGQFLRPILPSPRHVPGSVIEGSEDGFPRGLPQRVLLDCDLPRAEIREQHPALERYLRKGETLGVSKRYLPQHRRLWYRQESRPPAPILCIYMGRQNGGRAIRFLRNKSAATAPNVYLLLYPRQEFQPVLRTTPDLMDRLFEALEKTADKLVHGGRMYGGGLNKIEPRELESVELPAWVEAIVNPLGQATTSFREAPAAAANGTARRGRRSGVKVRQTEGHSLLDWSDENATGTAR